MYGGSHSGGGQTYVGIMIIDFDSWDQVNSSRIKFGMYGTQFSFWTYVFLFDFKVIFWLVHIILGHDGVTVSVVDDIQIVEIRDQEGLSAQFNVLIHDMSLGQALPAEFPWILESKVTSDGRSKATGAQGIHPSQYMALMDPLARINLLGTGFIGPAIQGRQGFWYPKKKFW